MTTIRLVLGDQLNPRHAWYAHVRQDVVYVMMEVRQETDYVLHHAQKIIAIFAAMRRFADNLRKDGHRVHYLTIDAPDNRPSLTANLDALIALYDGNRFEYQAPDEWRLDRQLRNYRRRLSIASEMVDSDHFYTTREEVHQHFGGREHWMMESFYRAMRRRHGVLMDSKGHPAGGTWNYDHDNRQAWLGAPGEPLDHRPLHDHSGLWQTIQTSGVASFGEPGAADFRWPIDRAEAVQQLNRFVEGALPHFGPYQDAMSSQGTRLFHSLLSFALNTKMLSPREVVDRAETAWRENNAPLASVEGFVRQILGWREYVRGVYWAKMPGYDRVNSLGHDADLPSWFWHGRTHMSCMAHAIGQSLRHAHAHHIQRLMVIGNFALLAGLDPWQVHRWYLGVYIDAFEWVELPNTLGMSQFVDGGLLATKPYISSGAYIQRMSDYCKRCPYDPKQRTGVRACPFSALYWNFLDKHRQELSDNPRLAIAYRQLDRIDPISLAAISANAAKLLNNLEEI
jgi:deoxyribodipyrimidine photolyase-related protein